MSQIAIQIVKERIEWLVPFDGSSISKAVWPVNYFFKKFFNFFRTVWAFAVFRFDGVIIAIL